jgi:hypothetical protein
VKYKGQSFLYSNFALYERFFCDISESVDFT